LDFSIEDVTAVRRVRILDAAARVIVEHGYASASVARITRRARVSSRTFYRFFASVEDCLLAIMDMTLDRLGALALDAFDREESWQDGLRMALASALRFLDEEPELTRVCFVEALAAGPAAVERREHNIQVYRSLVTELAKLDGVNSSPLAVEGVMASVVGIIYARLIAPEQEPLVTLLGPLTGWMMTPFLAHHEMQAQIQQATQHARKLLDERSRKQALAPAARNDALVPPPLRHPGAHRLRDCVLYLREHPGASNREISRSIGVTHQGQVSLLLTRLASLGMLTKQSRGSGYPCESALTVEGERVAEILRASDARKAIEVPVTIEHGRVSTMASIRVNSAC
jgi:AcrR family transcriptional regulator